MKEIIYMLPFILYLTFFALIIAIGGGLESFVVPDFFLLLALLLICGLGALSKKKLFKVIGAIALFIVSFALIKMGIENNYLVLAEVKIGATLLIYYLIAFIINKDKMLITMTGVIIGILLILFVPIKFQHRDGGSVEYRAIAYRFFKWNKLMDDGNHYNAQNLHWFPNNFHSSEYYTPVHWKYNDMLTITDDNIVKINTSYNISNVKYTEYKEEYINDEYDYVKPEFAEIKYESQNNTVDLSNLETGTYIITFTIHNDKDYADYAFKVDVIR